MTAPKLLALDTASVYFRAFYGMPTTLRSPDGRPVNAVRGVAHFLAHFLDESQATHAVCAWDVDWRPAWRVAEVPTYKTHRVADPTTAHLVGPVVDPHEGGIVPITAAVHASEDVPDDLATQVPLILQMLQLAGIATLGAEHCEADDVLATVATTYAVPVDVVTGDRDLFQLVNDARRVRVVYIAGGIGKSTAWDEAAVVAVHGVFPHQYADYALLRGDSSDGLPGVSGIGPTRAAALLARHGDLEGVLAAASDPGSGMAPGLRAKLVGAVDYLARARDVVRVVTDLPNDVGLDALRVRGIPDPHAWTGFCDRVGLGSAGQRLADAVANAAARG